MIDIDKEVAKQLLKIKAVFLQPHQPFTWASGLRSPIYCDNRLTLGFPETRKFIAENLAKTIQSKFSDADIIAGTATAGIPHAAWVSDILHLPMVYVRSKAKEHGKGNQIEGPFKKGQKIVVIEDLISTGGSALKAVEALRESGCDVLGGAAIFTYGLKKGEKSLKEANIHFESLTNYETLIKVALDEGYVTESDMQTLRQWSKDPEHWQK